MRRQASLVIAPNTPQEQSFPFVEQIVIGRRNPEPGDPENRIAIDDKKVSGRHCVVSQSPEGSFVVRDVSRNGTRLDGRRLVPNLEVELKPGGMIQVGAYQLELRISQTNVPTVESSRELDETVAAADETPVTIVVGDIRDYTVLSRKFSPALVMESVQGVFRALEAKVLEYRGTIKEYQGDAIFAFWEAQDWLQAQQTCRDACLAALWLDWTVQQLAVDPSVWKIQEFPLQMDWAVTSGTVSITSMSTGLAVVGDAVNYAFRLEKLATDETGRILTGYATHLLAREQFEMRDLGTHQVKGRKPEPVFALVKMKDQ